VDFSFNGKRKFRARFLPLSIYSVLDATKDSRLDWKSSLLSGNMVFAFTMDCYLSSNGITYLGASTGRGVIYAARLSDSLVFSTLAHELVHQFQFREYQVLNAWLKPFEQKVKSKTL